MSRYIDIEPYEKDGWYLQKHYHNSYGEVIKTTPLVSVPTADAEPVKHGHWIICSNVYSDGDYECSECHKREWNDTDYCPNCGAKMGEVKLTTSAEMNPEKYLKNLNEVKE